MGAVGDAGFPLIVHVGEECNPAVGLVDAAGYPRMSSELPVGRCRRGNGSWGEGSRLGVRDRMGVAGAEQDGTLVRETRCGLAIVCFCSAGTKNTPWVDG